MFGTVELPDKPIMLPPFVEATHCLGYHLTRKGRAVADRVVSVLGYACPDITYSPSLYPITAALLHFMPGEYCFVFFSALVFYSSVFVISSCSLATITLSSRNTFLEPKLPLLCFVFYIDSRNQVQYTMFKENPLQFYFSS